MNSSVFIWPTCVRLRRCKGCCTSKRLSCHPISVSIVNITIPFFTFTPSDTLRTFEMRGTRTFTLEQHDRCGCDCTELENDCTPNVHEYRNQECRCVCKNLDQQVACQGYSKIWNNRNCSCECRQNLTCSTGFYFNSETCRCEEI
ncbi:Vascular endothelial growth factor A, partial [Stegodyphus mimosarum]